MKASQMIKALQTILDEYGDLDLLNQDCYNVDNITVSSDPENYPEDYNMPPHWITVDIDD